MNNSDNTLPLHEIQNLGYSIEQFRDLGIFPQTINEFRDRIPQMVAGKFLVNGKTYLQGRYIQVKRNSILIMDLLDFIKIYHSSQGTAITGLSLVRDHFRIYQGELIGSDKLLFWSFGCGIGDLLFISTILNFIKDKNPKSKITWALPREYHSFVRSFNIVDDVISTPFDSKYLVTSKFHLHFDTLINHFRKGKVGNCYELMNEFANTNIPKEDLRPEILVMPQAQKFINKMNLGKYIVLHLNTSSPMRNPNMKFKLSILDKLLMQYNDNLKVLFVDSADKKKDIDLLIDSCIDPNKCINLAGKTRSMMEVAAVLKNAKCVVSVDTSIIHIATAVGTPIYGIYGPFSGEQRLSTYNNCKWVNGTCPISPCRLHQQEPCPQSVDAFSPCYNSINLDNCIEEIKTLI